MDCFVASLLAMTVDAVSRSRGTKRPKFCNCDTLQIQRAQGTPDACCTRGLVCKQCAKKRTRAYRYRRSIPTFPAQWLYGLCRALPGDEFLLPPSPANWRLLQPGRASQTSTGLTPATGAGTTRFCRTLQRRSSGTLCPLTDRRSALRTLLVRRRCRVHRNLPQRS